ncbi:ATP-grasp domain-containing protein [Paenibacillus aceris]|uniref:ATP-grasp superfamily ATP-dependent carboligase n=1 Tax=Paenibacillus aceris TaxID=869555 RepID=A0ABS4HTA1_9BACL|nr:putative ATP-grasp superfamily ATP-dependent carboligase [Paenibacillus aceris]NHW34358.1 ATP-grasp domain-containing protein [Paenibacillus aceris]
MSTVLCTNGVTSKALAVTRSLGARGIRVITADKHSWHTSGFSKFSHKSMVYPDPATKKKQFIDWVVNTVKREGVDMLFVMDDDTMEAVIEHRHLLEPLCQLTLPPTEGYRIAVDKGLSARLAKEVGVPCPETVEPFFSSEEITGSQLLGLTGSMHYPLAIKPRKSSGSRGIRFVHNENELLEQYQAVHREYPNPLIQEYIPLGPKYDVCVYYDDSHQMQASFVQREIRNFPADRGPSTVRESVEYPELISYSLALMDKLSWVGVADVEFMIDPRNGKPQFMEINPRFWSSVHLAICSGVDFPWITFQWMNKTASEPVHDYTLGQQGRALLPGDTLHYLTNPNRKAMDPPYWTLQVPDDIISRRDPWPTAGFFLSAIRYSLNPRTTWKFLIRR